MGAQATGGAPRRDWLGLMARAPRGRLAALLDGLGDRPTYEPLRPAEIGAVMVQGRAGGTGAPFNIGEMTVTRCSLRLPCGTVGHGYVQGRDKAGAEAAALCDAMLQTGAAEAVQVSVITTLADEEAARQTARASKAAATKVEFFTMVRGDD